MSVPQIIAWRPPSSDGRGKGHGNESPWLPVVLHLKQRPGEWALVVDQGPVRAASRALKNLGCEVRTRRNSGRDRADLYTRYPDQETTR